jgi:hypothetical protein
MKTKTLGHEQLAARILENRAVRAEHERLNREDFAILDEILAARRAIQAGAQSLGRAV